LAKAWQRGSPEPVVGFLDRRRQLAIVIRNLQMERPGLVIARSSGKSAFLGSAPMEILRIRLAIAKHGAGNGARSQRFGGVQTRQDVNAFHVEPQKVDQDNPKYSTRPSSTFTYVRQPKKKDWTA
jgi:hypothetical protein